MEVMIRDFKPTAIENDYIAIVYIGAGSSYGRANQINKAVELATKFLQSDWKHMFDFSGVNVSVNIYEVTGNTSVYWDDCGVHGDNEDAYPIKYVGVKSMLLPGKKKER